MVSGDRPPVWLQHISILQLTVAGPGQRACGRWGPGRQERTAWAEGGGFAGLLLSLLTQAPGRQDVRFGWGFCCGCRACLGRPLPGHAGKWGGGTGSPHPPALLGRGVWGWAGECLPAHRQMEAISSHVGGAELRPIRRPVSVSRKPPRSHMRGQMLLSSLFIGSSRAGRGFLRREAFRPGCTGR